MGIRWQKIDKGIPDGINRVLVYSPYYETVKNGDSMIYRIVDAGLVKYMHDATHWAELVQPDVQGEGEGDER